MALYIDDMEPWVLYFVAPGKGVVFTAVYKPRLVHLKKFAKKHRTRKKNLHRLEKWGTSECHLTVY